MANRAMAEMVYRRSAATNLSAHKSDIQTFNILLALDGKRTLDTIAKEDFYELDQLIAKVEQMLTKGLIEPAGSASGSIPPSFFSQFTAELTTLVGPVSGMLVKDSVAKMGHDINRFPLDKLDALLAAVTKFVQDSAKAADFQRRMRALAQKR